MIEKTLCRSVPVLLVAALATGCGGKKEASKQEASKQEAEPAESGGTAGAPGASAGAELARPPLPKIDEARARARLDRWLAAQNQGDFEAYQSCYAARVDGVKRVGNRVSRFDRAGWLKDRKRMFKKKMVVEMSDLQLTTTSTTARARFTQKWASGKYEDVGPKEILLVEEGDQLRIAHEEMLESNITRAPHGAGSADGLYFVDEIDGHPYLILEPAGEIAHGTPELVEKGGPYAARASVAEADLSADVGSWKGREVVSGDCRLKVTGFVLVDRVIPHFGAVQQWEGSEEDDQEPASDGQIAADVFGSGEVRVFGRLEGACDPGPFVRDAARPAWLTAEPVKDQDLSDRMIAAFRKLPGYREIGKRYTEEVGNPDPAGWEDHQSSAVTAVLYRHPKTGKITGLVGVSTGIGCGDFEGSLWALFEADAKGRLKPINPNLPLGYDAHVEAAIDLEGDGTLEWVIEDRVPAEDWFVIRSDGERLREVDVAYHDCPC